MLFYYTQDAYQKNQLGARLYKSWSKHNQQKSKHSECQRSLGVIFKQQKILGSKEHLDWLKTDLNAAEIITAQKLM